MTSRRTRGDDAGRASRGSSPPAADGQDAVRGAQGAGKGKRVMAGKPRPDAAAGGSAAGAARAGGGGHAGGGHAGGAPTFESLGMTRRPVPRSEVRLPLEVLTQAMCRCRHRGGDPWVVRVVERREVQADDGSGPTGAWEYYVHYRSLNRRLDEWVPLDAIDLDTVIPPEEADPADKSKRRRVEDEHSEEEGEGHEEFDAAQLREHEEFTKVKNVEVVELGRYEMETWYFSPFPPEYSACKKLYFCEYDLAFFKRRDQMVRHLRKVRLQHPPGAEIYRHAGVSMFEVDGRRAKTYCQNLCYLAKLFLDHKTLYYDVDLFLFYVLCECDERGAHPVGYFSKEKHSEEGFNLACILTFPAYQRRGYGKFLISFSYELSKIEGRQGTPERPLSDLGAVSYRGYWARVLLGILREAEGPLSIKDLSEATMFKPEDIISTLQQLNLIQYQKGAHVICAAPHVIEAHLRKCGSPGLVVEPSKIVWTPYNAEKEYGR